MIKTVFIYTITSLTDISCNTPIENILPFNLFTLLAIVIERNLS